MKLHIGREIESKYKESGIKLSEFAKRLSTSPRNVYAIFERGDIKTDLLQRISDVLNYNFFKLYNSPSQVNEPDLNYQNRPVAQKTVSVIVQLDGQEATLNQWVKRLTAINKSLE